MSRGSKLPKKPHIKTEDLAYDYFELLMNLYEVGVKHGMSAQSVKHRLNKVGYTMRNSSKAHKLKGYNIDLSDSMSDIIHMYEELKMTCKEIGNKFGCDEHVIRTRLDDVGIRIRRRGEVRKGKQTTDINTLNQARKIKNGGTFDNYDIGKESLVDKYIVQRMTLKDIAIAYNCSISTIQKRLERYGIDKREKCKKKRKKVLPILKVEESKPSSYYMLPNGEPEEGYLISGKLVGKNSACKWVKCDVCGKGKWITISNLKRYIYGGRCHDCIQKSKEYSKNVTNGLYKRYANPDEHDKSSIASERMWSDNPIRKAKQDEVLRELSKDPKIIKIRKNWSRQYWDDTEFGEVRRRKAGENFRRRVKVMWQDDDMRNNIVQRIKDRFKDKDYKEQQIRKMQLAQNHKQTNPERLVLFLLNKLYPKQWEYTGDWKMIIGSKNPDFANINGKKKLIELFGTYHHGYKLRKECPFIHQLKRIKHFQLYGYDTLIIWEHELKDLRSVTDKILEFCND